MDSAPYTYPCCKVTSLSNDNVDLISQKVENFVVSYLDGWMKPLSQLSSRPFIIETGSLNCPFFTHNRTQMDRLADRHLDIDFFVLFTREAYPPKSPEAHTPMTDKLERAHDLQLTISPNRRVILEEFRGPAHRWLGGLPNSLILVENGTISLHMAWNYPPQLEQYLSESWECRNELRIRNLPPLGRALSALANTNLSTRFHYGLALSKLYVREWKILFANSNNLFRRRLSSRYRHIS